MRTMFTATLVACCLFAGSAYAANTDCAAKAAEKKLSGAAKTSFVKKCEKQASAPPVNADCAAKATEKKLAGAAKTSFLKKCDKEAAAKKS